ncbi:nucleotide sugar dehydrogenase [Paraflavitalea soli]|uniref:hypothetical protein n=1 Tax=Paraflavitalea soli TaxID=2315862 RepID=UPI0026D66A63|nr:hypothetical protein [Paraflavitalea soli]
MKEHKIAIIGLGYVGLPLAVEFAKKYPVVGFDINEKRVTDLRGGLDCTLETSTDQLEEVLKEENDHLSGLFVTNQPEMLWNVNVYIITVPTPVDKHNRPDLTPLKKASTTVGRVLRKGDIVIYESTVYPGATEEECVPVLEKVSGLTFNKDFYVGYSPNASTRAIKSIRSQK